eukprot:NODE_88_length_1654_cov_479.903733_g86_i0.p1 GENE.NODE_88_length_1654_cov_479.903733_g86_i0~~NODE_88_length_1654_cov_479.903733_g86_i0.p1  ORF type:complete len:417 (+),score=82.60 NODE_88_length_1654_cov_479.903733_g86_i0:252-1502(+)
MDSVTNPLISKVRRIVIQRGGNNGIRGLSRSFRIMDDNNDHKINKNEFRTGMQDYGIELKSPEWDELFSLFDRDGDGNVCVTEFLRAIRGTLNPRRKAIVDKAYNAFDLDKNGTIDLNDLRERYDASRNPLVLQGKKTQDEVLRDFLNTFDNSSNPDGVVTQQEFYSYYAGVSSNIDNDELFEMMVTRAWNLDKQNRNQQTGSALTIGGTSGVKSRKPAAAIGNPPMDFGTTDTGKKYLRSYPSQQYAHVFLDISIDKGQPERVIIRLDLNKTPKTSENFRGLCTGEYGMGREGKPLHYKGLVFHRIVPGLCITSGDITRNNGKGGESIFGKHFDDESFDIPHDTAGVVSMVNIGPNTNNSQFFITTGPCTYHDGHNVAFGHVVYGMDFVMQIEKNGSDQGTPLKEVTIWNCGEQK